MVQNCCVYLCDNKATKGGTQSFHGFPRKNPDMFAKWMYKIRRKNEDGSVWIPTKNNRVCSAHFLTKDYYQGLNKKLLRETAVPSIFPNYPATKKSSAAVTETKSSPKELGTTSSMIAASHIAKLAALNDHCYAQFAHSQQTRFPKSDPERFKESIKEEPYNYLMMEAEEHTQQPEEGLIELQSFQLEEGNVKMLVEEYLYLYNMIQRLKDLSSINVDLLYLSMENEGEVKEELDRVKELVHSVMNGREVHALRVIESEKVKEEAGIQQENNIGVETEECNENDDSTLEEWDSNKHEAEQMTTVEALHEHLAKVAHDFTEHQVVSILSKVLLEEILMRASNRKTPRLRTGRIKTCRNGVLINLDPSFIQTKDSPIFQATRNLHEVRNHSKQLGKDTNVDVTTAQPVWGDEGDNFVDPDEIVDNGRDSKKNDFSTGEEGLDEIVDNGKDDSTLCSICGRKFVCRKLLIRHLKTHEDRPNSFMCDLCGKMFKSKCAVESHMKWVHFNTLQPCPICGKKITQQNLKRHVNHHSGDKPYSCFICHKQFGQKSSLKGHQMLHTGNFPHRCLLCNRGFVTAFMLKQHEKKHNLWQFSCGQCCKIFNSNDSLQMHITVCKGHAENYKISENGKYVLMDTPCEKPYICPLCQYQYSHKSSFAFHLLSCHSRELNRCVICDDDKMFTSFEDFELHLKSVHLTDTAKPYVCSTCGESFYFFHKLKVHRFLHKDKDALTCKDCGKSFTSYLGWKSHRLYIHSAELPQHSCDICGKNFLRKVNMKRHRLIHNGAKQFKCLICGLTFLAKDSLKTHSWTHSERKRYPCKKCDRGFNDKRNYLSHVQKWHQEDKI